MLFPARWKKNVDEALFLCSDTRVLKVASEFAVVITMSAQNLRQGLKYTFLPVEASKSREVGIDVVVFVAKRIRAVVFQIHAKRDQR